MDPLSISASITALLGLAAATATSLDALFHGFKSRPAVLLAISEEISALCLVFGQLEGQLRGPNSSSTEQNEKTVLAVLNLCMRTFQQIGSQISELQSKLRKGSLSKAYTFMMYPSRMKEISALRDDLEKYKVTLLIALQMHKPTEDSTYLEALRQEIERLRFEAHQPGISVDFERMDIIKSYVIASSTTLFGKNDIGLGSSSAEDRRTGQRHALTRISNEGQVGQTALPPGNEAVQSPTSGASDVPTFDSFNDWLFTFSPEIPDPKEEELLSAFRNRKKVNERTPTVAIDTVEVASPSEMIPSSDTLSLISQHLPIRRDVPDGKVHLIFVNLRKSESAKTFTEDIVTSPDTPVYKVLHELHQKGYTKTCGFQSVDRQSTYSPMVSHYSLLPVVVTAGSPNYNIPSGLQINIDERLIDFFNRFILDDPATPKNPSVQRYKDGICIRERRSPDVIVKFRRTLRVPEDGKSYPLSAYFASYPLLSVETFSDRLPAHMRKKGGLFIPMFQREALALDFGQSSKDEEHFAIRVYAGSINAISGKAVQSQLSKGEQDYIVVPKQRRLDGFLSGKGKIKQFVAMPLGFGYSVEKQVTGTEFIGGIQLEIIPRLSDKVKFIRPRRNTTQPDIAEVVEDLFRTPRELGMAPGQVLLMEDGLWPPKSKRMTFDIGFLKNNSAGNGRGQDFLPVYERTCRPTFVHEMLVGTGQHTYSRNESLVLHPVEPLSLRVDWQAIMGSRKGMTAEEYSPFLDISDISNRILSIKKQSDRRNGYLLFNGTAYKGDSSIYSPLAEHVPEGGIISFKKDASAEDWGYVGCSQDPGPSWEMTLGVGGDIAQSIEKSKDERLWDWGASKLINIQILNSVAFKEFTGVSPVTPISFREYVKAKIPFYSFLSVSDDYMIGDHATTFKSIGQLDRSAVIQIGIRVNRLGKPVGCANCEENICDRILQPCKHAFCSDCIKSTMTTDSSITCAFCSEPVSDTIAFSAPMEMPSSTHLGLKSIIPCRAEDRIHEVSSSLKTQQGDRNLSSNIVKNLIVVLSEMFRDSPKDRPDEMIANLVARSVKEWVRTPFDTAIRNLTRTSIDIRIPIFKAALPEAIYYGTLWHAKELLLLVHIDDLDDRHKGFVTKVINAAVTVESFAILFKWLTNGRRSIEDFGLSVHMLFRLVRFDNATDIILKFIADRKQTLSENGISILTPSEDQTYKLKKLIELGCDPNGQNAKGKTLLHLTNHSSQYLETLLDLGLRIDIVDNEGNTSIHHAVYKPYFSLGALLSHKSCTPAIINMRNGVELTAYHLSLVRPPSVRKQLLDAGADPKMEMPNGQFRDEVVVKLRKKDWTEYVLDDGLIRELQGTRG